MMLKIVVVEPKKQPYVMEIEDDLDSMKDVIGGGYIETFPLWYAFPNLTNLIGVCDEEGKLKELPFNRRVFRDVIAGTFFVVSDSSPEFGSLTDEEVDAVKMAFTIS